MQEQLNATRATISSILGYSIQRGTQYNINEICLATNRHREAKIRIG